MVKAHLNEAHGNERELVARYRPEGARVESHPMGAYDLSEEQDPRDGFNAHNCQQEPADAEGGYEEKDELRGRIRQRLGNGERHKPRVTACRPARTRSLRAS